MDDKKVDDGKVEDEKIILTKKDAYFWAAITLCFVVVFTNGIFGGTTVTTNAINTIGGESPTYGSSAAVTEDLDTESSVESSEDEDSKNEGNALTGAVVTSDEEVDLSLYLESHVILDFTEVPTINTFTTLDSIVIDILDLNSEITISGNELEVDSGSIELSLEEFIGDLKINENSISLVGGISQIKVNGVILKNSGDIDIEISSLNYNSVEFSNLKLDYVYLPTGDGSISIIDKLEYSLDQDTVDILDFYGQFIVSKGNSYPLHLEGELSELEVSGNGLDV